MGYSEVEKIQALAILATNGGDIQRTSRLTGISTTTLRLWSKEAVEPLDARLERLAHQLAAAMPEKLSEADLNQLTRALTVVLNNLKRTGMGEEKRGDVYEKLANLIAHYHHERRASEDSEPTDGG